MMKLDFSFWAALPLAGVAGAVAGLVITNATTMILSPTPRGIKRPTPPRPSRWGRSS
jgi:hypothetical protein